TRGREGTAAFTQDGFLQGEPCVFNPVMGTDTVGAGDACSAGLLAALVQYQPTQTSLSYANRVAGYVAGQRGATPVLPMTLNGL
ncbi:MAG: carbohydrate kinase family protein, partial [Pseudomonadota bacterium]